MFSILNRALSWAITSFGIIFFLKKRSRLIKALDNRFYVKFMELEVGLLHTRSATPARLRIYQFTFTQLPGLSNLIVLISQLDSNPCALCNKTWLKFRKAFCFFRQ